MSNKKAINLFKIYHMKHEDKAFLAFYIIISFIYKLQIKMYFKLIFRHK